jgi:hypothetical protein
MGLGDQINDALEAENNGELLRMRKQRDTYANQNVRLQTKLEELEKALSFVDQVDGLTVQPPIWLAPAKPKNHAATLVVMLSDTHFDEVVNPEEMEGVERLQPSDCCDAIREVDTECHQTFSPLSVRGEL